MVKKREASGVRSRPAAGADRVCLRLTPRERQILDLLVEGRTNKEIAGQLGVSDQTIKNRLTVLYQKASVSGRLAFVAFALRS